MPASEDSIVGDLALERDLITREQLAECLDNQKAMTGMGISQSLGEIFVAKNHVTRGQLRELLREERKRSGRQIKIGNYAIEAKLGEGGMGAVYKAKLEDTGAIVALKVLPPELAKNREFVARFRREAELASRLDHPNIVKAIEAGETGGYHFFVMEYVEGSSVGDRLKEDGAFGETEALDIVRQMTLALDHAQSAGLIHRDIKPDNIFVDNAGVAKLGDLGLARDSSDDDATRITQAGMMVGTPHYVSPEQATGNLDIDTRADIYSLGASLFHMLTGEVPFKGETSLEVLNHHLYDPLPWPADVNPEVSEGVCLLISKMMAKEPADRYQTPEELLRDLMPVIAGGLPTSVKRGASGSGRRSARSRKVKSPAGTTAVQAARRRTTAKSRRTSTAIEAARSKRTQTTWMIAAGSAALILVAALIAFSGSEDDVTTRPPTPPKPPDVRQPDVPDVNDVVTPDPVKPDPPKAEPPKVEPPRPAAPAVVGEARFGNASIRQLGGGRVEIIWEFDKPLDEDAWYLKNTLPGNSGGGSVVMDRSSIWPNFGRAMAPRAAFEGDLEVEATFSSRKGWYKDGPRFPMPSVSLYTAELQPNGRRRSVGLTTPWGDNIGRWSPIDRTDRPWPIGYGVEHPDCTIRLSRRGTTVERFYSVSPGDAKFEKVGSAYLPEGPVALDIGLNHGYCSDAKAKLERVRIVGKPCGGLKLSHPGQAVPKKPSAAQQWDYARKVVGAKNAYSPAAMSAYYAQIVHYPRSLDQIGGEGALYFLSFGGNPGDVIAAWRKVGGNFTESQALNSKCLLHVGRAYAYMGDPEKALTILRKGRDYHSDYGEALADLYRTMGRHDEAMAELERVIEKWPRFWAVCRLVLKIGHIHRAKGDTEKALARYREVVAKWPQYPRYTGEAKKAIAEIEADSKSTPGTGAPKSTGEVDFRGADVKDLGGGRVEVIWEFDEPLDKDAWYLWNVLLDDSGAGGVTMNHRRPAGSACHVGRSMIPRAAFKGDIEVEVSFTGLSGTARGTTSSPLPSLSLVSLEDGPGPRPAVRAFNQISYGFSGMQWGPITRGGVSWPGNLSIGTEASMRLVRRGTEVEFFFGPPGALKPVGRSTFPSELVGVDAALQHRWCIRYTAQLSRLRIVGTPAGAFDLPDPALSVPRMATAAGQVAHAKSIKNRTGLQSLSGWRAVQLYHPRAGREVREAMNALGNYGSPGEVLRMWTASADVFAADASLRSSAERTVATAYSHLGHKKEAVRYFSKGRETSTLSSSGLATTLFLYGDFDEAIVEADRLVAKWPTNYRAPAAQLLIGHSWRAKGDRQKALSAYRKMLAKWPKDTRCKTARQAIAEIEAKGN